MSEPAHPSETCFDWLAVARGVRPPGMPVALMIAPRPTNWQPARADDAERRDYAVTQIECQYCATRSQSRIVVSCFLILDTRFFLQFNRFLFFAFWFFCFQWNCSANKNILF